MNRQESSLYFRLRVVPYSPLPPNKAMQTDGRFATAADRQGVICLLNPETVTADRLFILTTEMQIG